MIDSGTSTFKVTGGGSVADSVTATTQSLTFGGNWPNMSITYTYAETPGPYQFNAWYQNLNLFIGKGQTAVLDLLNMLDYEGYAFEFTLLRRCFIVNNAPDGKASFQVGPGASGAAMPGAMPLWLSPGETGEAGTEPEPTSGAGNAVWDRSLNQILKDNPVHGWPVTSTSRYLCIGNPVGVGKGDDDLTLSILLLGVGSYL